MERIGYSRLDYSSRGREGGSVKKLPTYGKSVINRCLIVIALNIPVKPIKTLGANGSKGEKEKERDREKERESVPRMSHAD